MAEYTLYGFAQSGNSYKPALYLELAEADWAPRFVDFFNGETRTPAYREINVMGEAPVLEHRRFAHDIDLAVRRRPRCAVEEIHEAGRPVGPREFEVQRRLVRVTGLREAVQGVFGHDVLIRMWVRRSPAPGRKPFVQVLHPVNAPERLIVHDHVRRAEHAALDRGLSLGLETLLHHRVGDDVEHLLPVQADRSRHVGSDLRTGDVPVVHHVGAVEREHGRFLNGGSLRLQPIDGARRRLAGNRKLARHLERYPVQARAARHVAPAVVAFQRRVGQRHAAGHLEYDTEQEWLPLDAAAV